MGIQVEYNPELALRNISEFKQGKREEAECIPTLLEKGKTYAFLKSGQRNYWLFGEIPLIETSDTKKHSPPKASIIILMTTHFVKNGKAFTRGTYKVVSVFSDNVVHFNGFQRI